MKKLILILLLCSIFCSLAGCGKKQEAYTKTDFCFDTAVTVTIYDSVSNADKTNALLDETLALCHTYDDMLSRTKEGSDIYRINHAGGEWTSVSDETIQLLYSSLEYCEMTNGVIDITIAPVKDLWDFSGSEDCRPPAISDIEQKLSHVGYRQIEIKGSSVRLQDPEAGIDLGFIAKGYITDQLRAFLREKGVKHALINLGGNIASIGTKPDGSPFTIGIQEPFAPSGTYLTTTECSEGKTDVYSSVVTSGIYERCFTYNEKIYHHILDCKTGQPVRNELSSVTILTDTSLHADALSTTCILLGLEHAQTFIESLDGTEAIFITTDGSVIDTRK